MHADDWFDERQDADREMASLEAAGRAAHRGDVRMRLLLLSGDKTRAAQQCHHGWGYPTASPAATMANDPRAGQPGHRCLHCGSWWNAEAVAPITGRFGVSLSGLRRIAATEPCELPPSEQ